MGQNISLAVMAQRVEPHDSLDDFPTPPWSVRAPCVHILPEFVRQPLKDLTVWEPAANRGYMVRPLREHFGEVIGTDIYDYGAGFDTLDFLMPINPGFRPDLVWTNPPFKLAAQFVRRAMQVSRIGCAVLVRGTWPESNQRYRLFREPPPTVVAQFVERVIMTKGRLLDPNLKYPDLKTGKLKKPSTATAYAWVVFLHGQTDTRWRHIPPCRKALERDGDYPSVEVAL